MIEKQFINNLGHQQIIIDRLTVNNLALNTPLIITKFVNLSIYQRTERPQYSCRNPLMADYNRGGEIGSQRPVNKEDLSQDWCLLDDRNCYSLSCIPKDDRTSKKVVDRDTISEEKVPQYVRKQLSKHSKDCHCLLSTVPQDDRNKKKYCKSEHHEQRE